MRDSFLPSLSSPESSSSNWLTRIRANFQELLRREVWHASSANGAPIHLLEAARSPRASRAQGASLLTHAVLIGFLVALAAQSNGHGVAVCPVQGRLCNSAKVPSPFS